MFAKVDALSGKSSDAGKLTTNFGESFSAFQVRLPLRTRQKVRSLLTPSINESAFPLLTKCND